MTVNLQTIQVRRLIVHDVPQRFVGNKEGSVTYSYAPNLIDADLRRFVQRRLADRLEKAGYSVEPDPDGDQTMPGLISAILAGSDSDFVSISQQMADHLYQSQTGANPGGLLCVIEISGDTGSALALLKLARKKRLESSSKPIFRVGCSLA